MNIKILLALRYLAGRSKYPLSFSNLIAFLGIVIGLFSLIVVSSVMNGLSNDMARRIVSTKGEVRIFNHNFAPFEDYTAFTGSLMAKFPQVIQAGPVNHSDFLLRRRNYTAYTENHGIDFYKHLKISNIFNMIRLGNPTEASFKNNGIVLGLDISFQLNATVGDTIDVVSPQIMIPTPMGLIPKVERFRVVGVFQSGLPEFDRLYSFMDIDNSKRFKKHNGADYIEIKTNIKNLNFRKLVKDIEREFPHVVAEHWEIFDKTLFQAIKIEKIAMFVVMAIILVLASFNITGNFIRTVTEKREEIALLKTIGMDKRDIRILFIIMGFMIGIIGIVISNILAFILLYTQKTYEFVQIPVPGFPFTAVPVDLSFSRMLNFSLLTLIICLIGTIYPAYKTLKIDIIDVLKEENNN